MTAGQASSPPRVRGGLLVAGLLLYGAGAAAAVGLIVMVASADTALLRIDAPAAPALELDAGVYEVRAADGSSAQPAVFALGSREPLSVRPVAAGSAFEVREHGVYVVDLRSGAGAVSVHQRRWFVASPTLSLVLVIAPLATLPGTFLLDGAVRARTVEVTLGGSGFRIASVRRRLAAVVLDLVAMGVMLVLLLLAAPLFSPVAPLFPLAPVAYVWSGNARGRSLGHWLAGTRIVDAEGRAPGAARGLLRAACAGAGWVLLGTGHVVAALTSSRRAPHDVLAGTYVVYD